jgi:retinol-binding protein 3
MTATRAVCLVLLLFAFPLAAQTPQRNLTTEERQRLAELVPHLLETLYVLPDKGNELAALIRTSFESGKYDSATTAAALAQLITADLAVANDRHLKLSWTSTGAADAVLTIEGWKARRAAMAGGGGPGGPRGGGGSGGHGVEEAKVLEGNIGYLRIGGFTQTGETQQAIANAMATLADTDAMIVDVRNCPGGSGETVAYLASYFFGPEPRVLMRRHHRPSNSTRDTSVMDVPGKRRPDVPLFVLTGPNSASACESFAFQLQQWGRAKTVGEKTAGAGYNNMIVDLGAGLRFSISIGTALHGKTGKSFEAVGVQPDIAVPVNRALDAARAEALSSGVRRP